MSLIKQTDQKNGWNQWSWGLSKLLVITWRTEDAQHFIQVGLDGKNWRKLSTWTCAWISLCMEDKLDGKIFSVLLSVKMVLFERMRHCWVVQCWNEQEPRVDKKSLLQYQRWHNFSLLHHLLLLSIQVWGWKNKVLIPSENVLFYQKCVFWQMNADVHARAGVLCNWKPAENRKKGNAFLPCLKLPVILETQSIVFSYIEVFCLITSQLDNNSLEFLQREQVLS